MVAKRFMFVSAGLLCLAIAYHLGATSASAQPSGYAIGFAVDGDGVYAFLDSGDVYYRPVSSKHLISTPTLMGNFWDGATPAPSASFGQVKARWR